MNRRLPTSSASGRRLVRLLPASPAAFALLAALLVVGPTAPGCQHQAASGTPSQGAAVEPVAAKIVALADETWPRVVRVQGSLSADERVVVGAKVAGRVKEVPVDLGSAVARGDLLAVLDTEELELKIKQAEAQLAQARAKLGLKQQQKEDELDRTKVPTVVQEKALWDQAKANLGRADSLVKGKAIAVEELQQRQAAVAVAEAKYLAALLDVDEQVALVGVRRQELALVRQTLDDSKVPAPFDGIVEHRHVAPGAYVRVGDPIVLLVRVDPLRFCGGVPEREAANVREGQEATITVEGRKEPIAGRIRRISPALELASRSLVVEVDVPNPALPPADPPSGGEAAGPKRRFPLRAGVFAEAEIVVDPEARALVVPAKAVREFAGVEKVWLVRGGQAEEQIVQTGRRDSDRVEILQGLARGDLVLGQAQTGRRGPVVAEESPGKAAEEKR